jgi:hypothetical protein
MDETQDISTDNLSEETRAAIEKRRAETKGMDYEERLDSLLGLEDDW